MEKGRLDEAYRKYQFDWLFEHGYSVQDIVDTVLSYVENYVEDLEMAQDVREDFLLGGISDALYVCREEFEDAEFCE